MTVESSWKLLKKMPELDNNLPHQLRLAMTSEHTSYGSTKRYLQKLPTQGEFVLQGPGENAGVLDLGEGYALALRMESHNHPSAIVPFEGAATGVGGILRDIFTMGARPIGLIDQLRFGTDIRSDIIRKGVVRGIGYYGNTIGVPTVGGDIYFDSTYNENPLVNVAALGLVKKEDIIYGSAQSIGSDLIYIGARTGRDGVGGAQMASSTMDFKDEGAIQKADAFLENLLMHACCELAETGWIEGMQDMGAAGLLCSTTEVVLRGRQKTGLNLGSKVFLNSIPTKDQGLTARELLLSESQERMLAVGKRQHREDVLNLFRRFDLEAVVCGEVTNDGRYTLVGGPDSSELSMTFEEVIPDITYDWPLGEWVVQSSNHLDAGERLKKSIWRQYDWRVGTRTIKGPNQPGRYAILDIPEISGQLVISWSSDEGLSNYDPYKGVQHAFDTCLEKINRFKATPLGLTNCLNFGHPHDSMGAFAQTIDGLTKRCNQFNVPVVSGNVSLYNAHADSSGAIRSIKPTPILVMVGIKN